MLYLAIPAHNEVATIGVLLWRLRTVLAEFPREYEVVVYDDASTDETAVVAEQYERAMPVSVIRGTTRLGYAGAVDALLRHIAGQTRYPRRDAVLLLQGDFTDPPGIVPEFARRFEGGADLVVGERLTVADAPTAVKRLFKYGHWAMRTFVKVDGVKDLTATMRLVRISALREAIRVAGSAPLVSGDSWTANTDLLLSLAPHARRVESVPMEPTYGVRMRDTRRVAMTDAVSALKWAWGARGRRAVVGSSATEGAADDRRGPRPGSKRREEAPELSVERLREKVRERDGSRGIDGEPAPDPRRRRTREREGGGETERAARTERPERAESRTETHAESRTETRPERPARTDKPERANERLPRGERDKPRGERPVREGSDKSRAPRAERPAERVGDARPPRRRDEPRNVADAALELDDPFAAPAARRERAFDDLLRADETPASPSSVAGDADGAATFESERAASVAPRERPVLRTAADSTEDTDTGTSAATDTSESDLGADDGDDDTSGDESGAVDADGQPVRKRRRNRRSRRGRRKKDGSEASAGEQNGEQDGDQNGNQNGESTSEGESPRARIESDDAIRATPGDHIDGEPVRPRRPRRVASENAPEGEADGADDADDEGDDDEAGGVEGIRPRRRGRRGRRGGARRSRGRKEKGEGGGDDAPPSADE